ncbi:MAG: RHS repeat-associated core domain-containing protein, partial [Actinomycetota bacterium]
FGERVGQNRPNDRFGYAGAWGYQRATTSLSSDPYRDGFPFLHVGARYYDPASGRFLQRDPIGIRGGTNVYEYAGSNPVYVVDPSGLWTIGVGIGGVIYIGPFNFQLEISIHFGYSPSKGFSAGVTGTAGAGTGVGDAVGIGLVGTATNASSVASLLGVSSEGGVDTPIGGGTIIMGQDYEGIQLSYGPGIGAGVRVGPTYTEGFAMQCRPSWLGPLPPKE